jgi:predicted RNA-binding Zn ribbon-like protein
LVSTLPQHRRLVDGLVLPIRLGNHVALDFCNTLAGWGDPEPLEYLTDYAHLAVWVGDVGLLDRAAAKELRRRAERDPAAASRVLERARALREALYAACTNGATAAWETVAAEARLAAAASRLDPAAPPGARWQVSDGDLDLPVLELGRLAGEFLATAELAHVHRCPGHGCGWLFLDTRGRRRWCTMAVCGNRAKARRHAERARHGAR